MQHSGKKPCRIHRFQKQRASEPYIYISLLGDMIQWANDQCSKIQKNNIFDTLVRFF